MPDNMTPEQGKSSIDFTRSLGQPVQLPGSAETAKAARDFPEPEYHANVPDIRLQINNPFGPSNPNAAPENGNEHRAEDEANNRLYYRAGESLSSELISSAENPHELFTGLRGLEKMLEDGNIPQSLSERYTPPRELSLMYERASVLGIPIEDLVSQGSIVNYNKDTGEGIPKRRKYASLALSVEEGVEFNPQTKMREIVNTYNFGIPEKRAEMAKAYERAVLELEVRDIMGDHIGLRLNLDFRDNLEGLTEMLHGGRMPKFKVGHLEALFNMPGVEELENNPENHQLGDQVEEAMFLNLVMLNSGTKDKMKDFLSRPGANILIDRMRGAMDRDEWIGRYVGVVDRWVDDKDRTLTTYVTEPRGKLTQWSNIASFEGENPGDNFGTDRENEFIEGTVGKLVGSVEASWVAATMMRVIGAYASEGYVAIPPGQRKNSTTGQMENIPLKDKVSLKLGEGRYISSDDTGKFLACMFDLKEGLKGRASGLKDMIGRIPDMAMNLFDWAQVRVDDVKDDKGEPVKRSVWDAWLGTSGGKAKTDLLTGQNTREITIEEPYHRLGSLNFKSLDRDFHGTFTIMQWLMGRSERDGGLYPDARKTELKFDDDFALNNLKKKIKYIGICLNPIVLTKGSTHLYTNPGISAEIIQKNFFRNLMSARIHSISYSMNILGATARLFDPKLAAEVEVPQTKLVELFINEALKDNPKDESELIKHYNDNNYILRTIGTKRDVDTAVVNAKFEDNVGKVTGRKFE